MSFNRDQHIELSVENARPAVLVAVDDALLSKRCLAALQPIDVRLWSEWRRAPDDLRFDVIVVMGDQPAASRHAAPASAEGEAQAGIIALGSSLADADVHLPLDFQPRELLTTCRLLTQVVRLRRAMAQEQHGAARLDHEAYRDAVTQLPNRRGWDRELARWLMPGGPRPFCLALVDMDYFKQVNDGWGHAAGDQLLAATGSALRQSLRQDDFVARLGGDEFGLLLAHLAPSAAAGVLERIQSGLPGRIAVASRQVASVSIGFACLTDDAAASGETLMQAADAALRQAKQQGCNCVVAAG